MKTLQNLGFYLMLTLMIVAIWTDGAGFIADIYLQKEGNGKVDWAGVIWNRAYVVVPILFIYTHVTCYRARIAAYKKARGE